MSPSYRSTTSVSVHSLPLFPPASIGHYLTSSILSVEENPPTYHLAEQPHCHQSAPILLWGEIGSAPSILPLFTLSTPSSPYTFHAPLSLLPWHILFHPLYLCLTLTLLSPLFFLFSFTVDHNIKQITLCTAFQPLIKKHYVGKHSARHLET